MLIPSFPFLLFLIAAGLWLLGREMFLPFWFYRRSVAAFQRGHREEAKGILEGAIRRPLVLSSTGKILPRYQLAWYYMSDQQYAAAVEILATGLRVKMPRLLAAHYRRRLAECLEGSGREEEAREEWGRVFQLMGRGRKDAGWYLLQGKLLAERQQHAEACAAYEAALAAVPKGRQSNHLGEILVRLAISSYDAGRPADAVRWGESAIAAGVNGVHLSTAHSMAGVGYSSLRNIEKSAEHRQRAYEIARADGRIPEAARYLATLASVLKNQGRISEALAAADEALAMHPSGARMAWLVKAEAYRALGNWDAARDAHRQSREAEGFGKPSAERRAQSTAELGSAWIELEAEQPRVALEHLQRAAAGLKHDSKLAFWCECSTVLALAQLGQGQEAWARLHQLVIPMRQFQSDEESLSNYLSAAGRTLLILGQPADALETWKQYLARHQMPVNLPRAYYYSALCYRALGDEASTRAALQQAVAFGFDTYHSRLAAELLGAA